MKIEWTVRVINVINESPRAPRNEIPGVWVEQLRYMGHAKELAHLHDPERTVIEFYAPRGLDSKVWAEQNANRMQSFGINAAAAPIWRDESVNQPSAREDGGEFMERHNQPLA